MYSNKLRGEAKKKNQDLHKRKLIVQMSLEREKKKRFTAFECRICEFLAMTNGP
jgi:hypothetical protein